MVPEISAALSAVTAIKTAVANLVDIRDAAKIGEIRLALLDHAINLQAKVLELYESVTTDRHTIATLRGEIAELRAARDDRSSLVLEVIGAGGRMAYRVAANDPTGDVEHFVCQPCYDTTGKRIVLQPKTWSSGQALTCTMVPAHELLIDAEKVGTSRPLRRNPYS